ncbi:CASP-like protein 4D1 [Rhodamnia argentea]|uniref:CASP-like protein n=1 Tax=Rhodamnia argentea TaxID=178133 RepID=A0A8B8MRH3_9MYRT|nr:CASP-like protein 4D1 [Rhodamnia argentea]
MASRAFILALRLLTLVFLVISVAVLTADTANLQLDLTTEVKVRFWDVYTYRYMLGTIVVGAAYTLIQIARTLCRISKGNQPITSDASALFDFFADKIASYVLATGSAAGFGATKDLKLFFEGTVLAFDKFFDKGYAAASLLLLAFVCAALLSIVSSFALPKKV